MNNDPEITALTAVYVALKDLDTDAQQRVLEYVSRKLGLVEPGHGPTVANTEVPPGTAAIAESLREASNERIDEDHGNVEGISPVALKWIRRSGFSVEQLGVLFSLGADEIDLVAKCVPGTSKNARTRSVALLKGIAAYLSTGAARITSEQIKEACLHYDAYDAPNHARHLKGMAGELSGNKSSGFMLTARGLTAGTELIKEILGLMPGD